MSADCVFCRIVTGTVPATIVHETGSVLAFRDLNPQAPTHVLVIPKEHHPDVGSMARTAPTLAGEVLTAADEVATIDGVRDSGYRLVFNTGRDANQTVFHVHCHMLGARTMTWPPG
ncbi:MAG: HIT domain-containing protein [Pseudonocardiaceae bacterium]|nr:HIT domain-containing protein [Pseudonocardiaceae bacterium]